MASISKSPLAGGQADGREAVKRLEKGAPFKGCIQQGARAKLPMRPALAGPHFAHGRASLFAVRAMLHNIPDQWLTWHGNVCVDAGEGERTQHAARDGRRGRPDRLHRVRQVHVLSGDAVRGGAGVCVGAAFAAIRRLPCILCANSGIHGCHAMRGHGLSLPGAATGLCRSLPLPQACRPCGWRR